MLEKMFHSWCLSLSLGPRLSSLKVSHFVSWLHVPLASALKGVLGLSIISREYSQDTVITTRLNSGPSHSFVGSLYIIAFPYIKNMTIQ